MLGPTSEPAIPSPCVLARGWVPRSPLIHTCHTSARTQRRGDTWERRGGKKWHFGEQTHLPLPVEAPALPHGPSPRRPKELAVRLGCGPCAEEHAFLSRRKQVVAKALKQALRLDGDLPEDEV